MFQSICFVDSPAFESAPTSGSFLYVRYTAIQQVRAHIISYQLMQHPFWLPLHLFWDRQLWLRRRARHNDPTVQGVEVGLHGLGQAEAPTLVTSGDHVPRCEDFLALDL